ncbi:MAG: hypothetical protein ABFD80_07125 [Acidobacteriota bacterium]
MKAKILFCSLAVLTLIVQLPAQGAELPGYRETVDMRADGSAEVRLSLVLPAGGGLGMLIPLGWASPKDVRVQGQASVSVVDKDGKSFLSVDAAGTGSVPLVVSFQVEGCFKSGRPESFGNYALSYRFINVTFDRIGKFGAELILPPGYVFNDVGDFAPKAKAAGGAVPYVFGRTGGRDAARLAADDLKLGEEVRLGCTFKSARKSKPLLFVLAVLAAAYLVFFRGLLKSGNGGGADKP